MKVVHITTMDFGGAGMAVIRIHEALLKLGIESSILVLTKITDTPGVISYLPKSSNKYIQGVLNRINNLRRRLWEYRNPIVREFKKKHVANDCFFTFPLSPFKVECHPLVKDADVIHLHWIQNFVNYPSFFSVLKKPCLWTYHDENIGLGGFHYYRDFQKYYEEYKKSEDYARQIKQDSFALKSNLHLVPLSKMMNDFISNVPYCSHWDNTVVHNPVDTSVFQLHEKKECRISLNLPLDNKIVLFVAYDISDNRKGLERLINALKIIDREDILLCCVGGSDKMQSIDIGHILLGAISDESLLSMVYSAADLFVLASEQEAFAQTPLESIASGTPVVVTPCSGTEELINDNNGVRCGDFSVEELALCIKMAINKSYDPQIMRQDIIERFSPEHIAQQYIDLYHQMMGEQ